METQVLLIATPSLQPLNYITVVIAYPNRIGICCITLYKIDCYLSLVSTFPFKFLWSVFKIFYQCDQVLTKGTLYHGHRETCVVRAPAAIGDRYKDEGGYPVSAGRRKPLGAHDLPGVLWSYSVGGLVFIAVPNPTVILQ